MTDEMNVNTGEEMIRQIIDAAEEITTESLEANRKLAEQVKTDKGKPFTTDNVIYLADLKRNNRPKFENLRGELKDAGVRVGEQDKEIEACDEEGDSDDSDPIEILLGIAKRGRLFHTPDGKAFSRLPIDDHEETWAIRSQGFRKLLTHEFYRSEQYPPGSNDLDAAIYAIEAQALFGGSEERVFLRIAELDERVYIDLCNPAWQAVQIDQTGWRILDDPPVNFRRASSMVALPIPKRGGSIDILRQFLNLETDDHFVLLVSAILSYFRPSGPYPVIALIGEQGTAKTSTARTIRNSVDPNTSPVRALPRELRDLAIAANNAHVLAFDNISGVSPQMSDALCRLSTGGGFSTRQLYTDDKEAVFEAQRPIILTGIEDMIERPDLADRSIFIELARISDEMRRPERELKKKFEQAWPEILGALLDGISHGLRNLPTMSLQQLPRMADFAVWAAACETAFWPSGTFMEAYQRNREHAVIDVLDADLVAQALLKFIGPRAKRTVWTGTAGQLLSELEDVVDDDICRIRQWPDTPRALSGRLRRAAPFLRQIGIRMEFSREGRNRDRVIHLSCDKDG